MSDIYFSRKQAGLGWAVDYMRNHSTLKRNEEIEKIKDKAADKKASDSKTGTLATNVVGSTTGLLGSGVITAQAVSKIKDIKQRLQTARQVARLMGYDKGTQEAEEAEQDTEQVSNEDFFRGFEGLEETESKVEEAPEEAEEGFQISEGVFDDIEAEQAAAQEAAQAPRTAASLFQNVSTAAEDSSIASQMFNKTPEMEQFEMDVANFKSAWRGTLVEMNPEEAEQFINEGTQASKPAEIEMTTFSKASGSTEQAATEGTEATEATTQAVESGETSAAALSEGVSSSAGAEIEMTTFSRAGLSLQSSIPDTSDIITSGTQFYTQTEEGVTTNVMTDADMADAPLHAYERSNAEMLRTGWKNPRSYESDINDIPEEVDEPQMAPEAVSEMKPVISSSGKLVGVSKSGANLAEEGEEAAAEAEEVQSGASEAVSTLQSTVSGIQSGASEAVNTLRSTVSGVTDAISSGAEAAGELAEGAGDVEALAGGLDAASAAVDTAAGVADTVAGATAAVPILDIVTAAVGAVVTVAGIGLTIGSTVASAVAANNEKQATAQTEEQIANLPTTQGNLAGKYVLSGNNNIYNLNHNY